MTWAAPVVILDLDDTLINFTGMAEELWRVLCDEVAPDLGLDGAALHTALMTERVAFWADPVLRATRLPVGFIWRIEGGRCARRALGPSPHLTAAIPRAALWRGRWRDLS